MIHNTIKSELAVILPEGTSIFRVQSRTSKTKLPQVATEFSVEAGEPLAQRAEVSFTLRTADADELDDLVNRIWTNLSNIKLLPAAPDSFQSLSTLGRPSYEDVQTESRNRYAARVTFIARLLR